MKLNLRTIMKYRHYSEDFKRELVCLYESGKFSVPQLERLYGISNARIHGFKLSFKAQ